MSSPFKKSIKKRWNFGLLGSSKIAPTDQTIANKIILVIKSSKSFGYFA